MERYKVLVSRRCHQDLKAILSYIFYDLKAPIAASNFLDTLEETVQGLKEMPCRFNLVKDEFLQQQGYRKFFVKNCYEVTFVK
jgi:toxin ParE1/3/4